MFGLSPLSLTFDVIELSSSESWVCETIGILRDDDGVVVVATWTGCGVIGSSTILSTEAWSGGDGASSKTISSVADSEGVGSWVGNGLTR